MKFTLRPGAELDILTPAEMREIVRERWLDTEQDAPVTYRAPLSFKVNAAGDMVTVEVITVPLGRRFKLHRLVIWLDGFTPVSPFQDTDAYLVVRREGGQRVSFLPLTAASGNGLPAYLTDGGAQGAEFVNGEKVEIELFGLPANVTGSVYAQGDLLALAPTVVADS